MPRVAATVIAGALSVMLLAACSSPTKSVPVPASASHPVGKPTVLVSGLDAPWSILRLGDSDSTLISERDTAHIEELTPSGKLRTVGTVPGVVASGEGGLLGIEALHDDDGTWVYAYTTTATDNRIVRMPLVGSPGNYGLGAVSTVLTGLAKAGNHNGGRIKFGPDGMLYATVGDAGQPDRAQDPASLNGKILRMTSTGEVPADNPTKGSLVYSMGHRNPQGIAWDSQGQLWAAEFGQDTWDELNRIVGGANYGWPTVEGFGTSSSSRFTDPVYEWPTDDASPSGLAFADGSLFLAALRGERLWTVHVGTKTTASASLIGEYGRLRDVVPGPGNTLWVLTNNTDGRGTAGKYDDRLLQVRLTAAG
ncbi:MAG: glucose dehydrogenase [Microbacteriaceae bacterium]|nr:glucose dehydrogenase [Microbacteriaceae bacterium]